MKKEHTEIIFIWHMHQPYYRLPGTNYYLLPWVRLHGVKDYYGMAKMIDKFCKVKVTFNFSGVLLQQLKDYVENKTKDYYAILTLKKPEYLNKKERDFIVERFFSVNFERFIRPHKRYAQLHQKKLTGKKKFTPDEIRDLQAIFNLCWFHPYTIKQDKNLRDLIYKGSNYTEEDKKYIIEKQYNVLDKIFPLYRKLIKAKRIELSVTPHYHPILPLIYDTGILQAFPYLKMPRTKFSYPKDCNFHLGRARRIAKELFLKDVEGSWPSEGSISEDVLRIYNEHNFKWIGADEGILFKSLTSDYVPFDLIKNQRHLIYKLYNFEGVNIFFRDRNLSDAISFIYQGWEESVFAANDLLEHFKRTHYHIRNMFTPRAITIIMDGENAWEYYKNNGVEFLETVYAALEKSDILSSCTPQEFMMRANIKKLSRLAPGSWINSDFGVWIGSGKNNRNWHLLKKIRNLIEKEKKKDIVLYNRLMSYFYVIEGSDWNWWNTFEDFTGDFARIFSAYIQEIYHLLNKQPPNL